MPTKRAAREINIVGVGGGGFSTARSYESMASFHLLFFITRIFKSIFMQIEIFVHGLNLRQINLIKIWHLPVQNIRQKLDICAKGQEGNSLTCSSK
jgi:hypothetical protein